MLDLTVDALTKGFGAVRAVGSVGFEAARGLCDCRAGTPAPPER